MNEVKKPLRPLGPVVAAPSVRAMPDQIRCLAPSSRAHCLVATFLRPGHPVNGNIPLLGSACIASPGGGLWQDPRRRLAGPVTEAAVFETREPELIPIRRNPWPPK